MKKLNNLQPKFMKAVLMTMVMLFFVAPNALKAQGTGTEADPFLISTKAQLEALRDRVNASTKFYHDGTTFVATNGSGYTEIAAGGRGKYFKLTADIVLNSGNVAGCDGVKDPSWTEWTPIGYGTGSFYGHFNGDNHLISGIYFNKTDKEHAGLFGTCADSASVKNLGVVNSYISGKRYIGGIVGEMLRKASVTNCFVNVTIVENASIDGGYTGGIAGLVNDHCLIQNVYAAGSLYSVSYFVGGIVGWSESSTIRNCYSSMLVSCNAGNTGGIVGYDNLMSTVDNCYFDVQMCNYRNDLGMPMLTSAMTQGSWTDLGLAFQPASNRYPSLSSFDADNNDVKASQVCVILPALSVANYTSMSDIRVNFELSSVATWEISSTRYAHLSGNTCVVERQGWFQLIATVGDRYKVYSIFCNKDPRIGTAENPFWIDDLTDLKLFRDGVNSGSAFVYDHYTVPAGAANTYFQQAAGIDMESVAWTPIGNTQAHAFRGIYNGGHYELQNLKLETGNYKAFFGYVQDAVINNVEINGIDFNGTGSYKAGLVAYGIGLQMDSCHTRGGSLSAGSGYPVAGVVAYVHSGTLILNHCTNDCDVTSTNTDYGVGGVLGKVVNSDYVRILNCHNSGNITSASVCGGVVGRLVDVGTRDVAMEYCSNSGNITASGGTCCAVAPGGVLGYASNYEPIRYCWNTGNVTGKNAAVGVAGGYTTCYYCYNTGTVSLEENTTNTYSQYIVAGINISCPAYYCFNAGTIKASKAAYVYGITTGTHEHCFNAGDIVGGNSTNVRGVIGQKNYNIGRVEGRASDPAYDNGYFDKQRCPNYRTSSTRAKNTSDLLGSSMSDKLSADKWVFSPNMYPRIKGLENLPISKALAMPVKLVAGEDVDHVSTNFQVAGCDSSVVWEVYSGSGVTSISGCSGNLSTATVNSADATGATVLAAKVDGEVYYTITLQKTVTAPTSPLTVASLSELEDLRDGVNSGASFTYKGNPVPQGGEGTTFKLTADISSLPENWEQIGSTETCSFKGTFDGQGYTISGLTQNGVRYGGLFGVVEGKIMNLNLTDVNINTSYRDAGAVCTTLRNGSLENCSARGTVTTTVPRLGDPKTYVGGLVGGAYSRADLNNVSVKNCTNYCDVSGHYYTYVGGVAGMLSYGVMDSCANFGHITSNYYGGGVVGSFTYGNYSLRNCYNAGKVEGKDQASYLGGITGRMGYGMRECMNTGEVVMARTGNTAASYVGGITGDRQTDSYSVESCVNTGRVDGANRTHVGGIAGIAVVRRCINANSVTGDGAHVGAIAGEKGAESSITVVNNFYDKQMCDRTGFGSGDVTGKAEGKNTIQMVSDSLKAKLKYSGENTYFTYNDSLYPSITSIAATDAMACAAAPLFLNGTENIYAVNHDFKIGGCANDVAWSLASSSSVTFDCTDHTATITGRAVDYAIASKNGVDYKKIYLAVRLNADAPLVIKNHDEFVHFREAINGTGYYYHTDSTFSTTPRAGDVAITNGGEELFFKLICDVDLSADGTWTPIGTTEQPFRGYFNGDGHTIRKITISGGDYQGLFGKMENGSIEKLRVMGSVSGAGRYRGLLCGYNTSGNILNCSADSSKLSGTPYYASLICGYNTGYIYKCFAVNDTITTAGARIGSICGQNNTGTIRTCFYEKLIFTNTKDTATNFNGGLCGLDGSGMIDSCYGKNSVIDFGPGGYSGGICGYGQSDKVLASHIDTVTITANANYIAGIIAYCANAYVRSDVQYCYTQGGSLTNSKNYTAGIVSYADWNKSHYTLYCTNNMVIRGYDYVGGITNYSIETDYCKNFANVYGHNYVGGITSGCPYVYYSYNAADTVKGNNYVGGICGNQTYGLLYNYNIGHVIGNDYVGGVVGQMRSWSEYNYNAGYVVGNNRVGGIAGYAYNGYADRHYLRYSFNVGNVEGNTFVGAVVGEQRDDVVSNCFYDSQTSWTTGGANGEDIDGVATPKLTSEMTGEQLQSILGSDYFTYSAGLYPRQKKYENDDATILSATTLNLPDTLTVANIPSTTPTVTWNADGCSNGITYTRLSGKALTISGCTFTVANSGIVFAKAAKNGINRYVKFAIGISEQYPVVIKNQEQFLNFRNFINANAPFYYDAVEKQFYENADPAYMEIPAGGEGMYFRLDCAPNLTSLNTTWVPIGTATSPFKGYFNGNKRVVSMPSTQSDFAGLFGYNNGDISYLTVRGANINSTQEYTGALCGNNAGFIRYCSAINGTVRSNNDQTGGLVGYSNGFISYCYNSNTVTATAKVGGIVGEQVGGQIKGCFNMGDITGSTTGSTYVGGIAGISSARASVCYNVGTITGDNHVAGIAGKNTGSLFDQMWNAGQVVGGTGVYVSALTNADASTSYPTNSAYDRQMCVKTGSNPDPGSVNSLDPTNSSRYTTGMVGTELNMILSASDWTFSTAGGTDDLYPRITALDTLSNTSAMDASIVSATPIFLNGSQTVRDVATTFDVNTTNGVNWDRQGTGAALNITNINTAGTVRIANCGTDALRVSKGYADKVIRVIVNNIESAVVVDSTCGEPYQWAANSRYYTESGEYVEHVAISSGCDSILALRLEIPDPLEINMTENQVNCNGGRGSATAAVTGCWNNYIYEWKNESEEVIGSAASIDNLLPGTYTFKVTSALRPVCTATKTVVITEPEALVVSNITYDAGCYNSTEGSFVSFDIEGGVTPYNIAWSGAATGSRVQGAAGNFTVTSLVDGDYDFVITDDHDCPYIPATITIQDTDLLYKVTAYTETKYYDNIAIDPHRYILQIGTGAPDTLTAGVGYKLPTNDTLYVNVSATGSLIDVSVTANNVTECRISRNGVDRTCRYNLESYNSYVTINRRPVTLTSCSASQTYNGNALTCSTVEITSGSFVDGQGVESYSVTGTRTEAGVSPNAFDYTLTATTNADNYNITKVVGSLTVNPDNDQLVWGAITDSAFYSGSALVGGCNFVGTLASGHHQVVTYSVTPSQTEAGTLNYKITSVDILDANNGDVSVKSNYTNIHIDSSAFLKVKPLPVDLYSESASITYNGSALTRPNVTVVCDNSTVFTSFISNLRATGTATNYTPTPVENTIEFDEGTGYVATNFAITYHTGTLAISQKDVTVTGETNTLSYNGENQTITGMSVEGLLSGHTLSGLTYAATGKNQGDYDGDFTGTAVIKDGSDNLVTDNYHVVTDEGVLHITASGTIVVTSEDDDSHIYDNTNYTHQVYSVTYNGVAATEVPGYAGKKFTLSTGDMVTITPYGTGNGQTNAGSFENDFTVDVQNEASYATITLNKGTITIQPRPVTLSSASFTKTYDGLVIEKPTVTPAGYGFVSGQGATYTFNGHETTDGAYINVGSYRNIFQYELTSATLATNYRFTLDTGMLNVTKAPALVSTTDLSRAYGENNPVVVYTISDLQNGETEATLRAAGKLTGAPLIRFIDENNGDAEVTNATTTENNPYTIELSLGTLEADNYYFNFQNARLTILGRALKLVVRSYTAPYDGLEHDYTSTAAPHYDIDHTDTLRVGDRIDNIEFNGKVRFVGNNTITFSNLVIRNESDEDVTTNYDYTSSVNGQIKLEPRELKLKPEAVTVTYDGNAHGQADVADPYYTFLDGTSLATTDEIHSYVLTGGGTNVGTYTLAFDSAQLVIWNNEVDMSYYENVAGSYHITFETNTLTIEKSDDYNLNAPTTLTRVYNGLPFAPEATVSDYVTGNVFTIEYKVGEGDWTTTPPSLTNVGSTTVQVRSYADNYNQKTTSYTFEVTPADITLEADNKTKVYDNNTATDPALTATVTGKPTNGVDPVYSLSREPGQTVGDYAITLTAEAAANPNYTISSTTGGTFSITKAALTIKLDTAKTYDGEAFVSDYVYQTDGYTITGLQGAATITNGAVTSSGNAVGTYIDSAATNYASITTDFATSDDISNYEVTYDFKQVINKAEITITAEDKTKQYDNNAATDPALTAVVTGAPADGIPPVYSLSREAGQNAGEYAITVTAEADDNPNYTVNTVAATFSITKAPLTIKLDTTKNYDGAVFVSNYAATTDGYTITGLQGTATITAGTVTSSGSGAGTYVDSASTNSASITVDFATSDGIDNYDVTYDFKQVIIKADLTITINATKEYDQTALTVPYDSAIVSVEGLMTGDALTAGVVTTNAVDAATYTHTGGTVNITTDFATTLGIDNYEVIYNVTLNITPRTGVVVTVQEHGAEYEYDGSTHSADGYSISINDPLYQTSDFTFSGTASVTGTGTETGLNFYPMTLSAGDFTNINPNFTNVTFTILDSALYIYPKLKATVTSVTGVSCPGATNGTATISVTGGKPTGGEYSFSFDGGLAEAFTAPHLFENLSAGSHTVVVTDSLNYTATANFTIDELAILTATIVTPAELCPNQGNYPVSVNVSGGTAPYTYTWTGAQDVNASATAVVQTEVNDGGTAYTVSVSILDANSCPIAANATFTVKPSVTKTTSLSDIVCPADMNITLRYGVYDTLLTLIEPTWTSNIPTMPLTLVSDAPVTSRFAVREGREDSTYTIHWHLVDTCGADSLICTQTITVAFPACAGTVTDANGNSYEMVRLGANCWTRSNLATPAQTRSSANGVYKYNNDDALAAQFGLLYSWYAACHLPEGSTADPTVVDGHVQGICPTGWALPTAEDFIIMVDAIGGVPYMKIADDNFWISGLGGALPSSGFDALGAGYYKSSTDTFEGLMTTARFWTSTPSSSTSGTAVQCAVCEGEDVLAAPKSDGYSVRCVKINE